MRLPGELVFRHPLEDPARHSHFVVELREQRVHESHDQLLPLPKFTFGTCSAAVGALKSGYSLKPKTLAVMLAGNWRRSVLYCCTRSLYRMRSTAIRFSVPDSSSINRLNDSLDRSCG